MTEITTLVSNDDITVLGPPSVIDVLVDVGPQGVRGSRIFAGLGNPTTVLSGQSLELYDLYINAAPGANYGYMYQYISQPGGNTWTQLLKINPAIYSTIQTQEFVSGVTTITVPISSILTVTGTPPTASNFVVQHSIEYADPVASSIEVPALTGLGTDLVVTINAATFNGTSWSALNDSDVKVHLFISLK